MRTPTFAARRQQGAALIIGLVLLLVLTLLAVSSMSSASLEFIMAGNEQYRSNAFQAAEVGIEQTLMQGSFNPADPPVTNYGGKNGVDPWASAVTLPLGAAAQPALWGNSWNSFSTYHFEVASTGNSVRGANAVNTQGVALFSPYSPDVQADPNQANTALN
jgi:type IV pilus assembly protein PilX